MIALLLAVAGCNAEQPSPVAPTVIQVPVPVGPSGPPPQPPGPHFALEIQPASTGAVTAGEVWRGLITITPIAGIVQPVLPTGVIAICSTSQSVNLTGFASGSAMVSCLLPVGTHVVTAQAQTADRRITSASTIARVLEAPTPPPPPTPPPDPAPRPPPPTPIVRIGALELHKNKTEATWRFTLVVDGELENADFDFGAGSSCENGNCTLDDEDDYIDVEYSIAGTKEVRVNATVDDKTIRASRQISVTFAP